MSETVLEVTFNIVDDVIRFEKAFQYLRSNFPNHDLRKGVNPLGFNVISVQNATSVQALVMNAELRGYDAGWWGCVNNIKKHL